MMFSANDMARRALLMLLCCVAAAGAAQGQQSASLDSLVAAYLAAGQTAPPARTERQPVADLGLLLQRQLTADIPLGTEYFTLDGFWDGLRRRGLADVWRQGNAAFLAKPEVQRTGEGLIPDIQMPLPVLGKMLGSGAEIKLNGLYKFTLGGQQTVYPNNKAAYALGQQGSNFDLKIKQDYRVDLEGVVGDRVHVLIDYDSQIETEKKSKVRLRYEGKEDEILQSLEAGDTEFSITGSTLTQGLSTVHKGLFGIKAVTKLAGLELTAIASKDEGQSQTNTFTAGSSSQSVTIDDTRYIRRRFFRLPIDPVADSLAEIQVYLYQTDPPPGTVKYDVLAVNQSWRDFAGIDKILIDPMQVELKPSDYYVFNDPFRPNWLFLRQGVNTNDALGVVLHVYNKTTHQTRRIPDSTVISPDTLSIMLIKPTNCNPPDSVKGYAWNYELRNFYDLGSPQITNPTIRLQKKTGGSDYLEYDSTSGASFLTLSGLDPDSNGTVDANYLRLGDDGYFFTPDERPFDAAWGADPDTLPDRNPDIYRTANPEQVQSKYRFAASYFSSGVSYRFLASTGRIIEGSVRAYLNGAAIPASDYRVDYEIGEIEFTNEETKQRIKQQGTQLQIDYQYLPTFALGSKTLAGVRGVYKFSDKAMLGGTWLYRSEQTPEERPRLGEEPRRIIVAGLDGSVEANPGFLTRAADALPLVETEAPSSVKLAGEIAANFPNPNTRGEVYIDDMDGAKQSDGLMIDRRYWSHSSRPPDKTDSLYAAQCYWYNPTVRPTQVEINENMTDENAKDDPVSTMRLHVDPLGGDTASWAGITSVISKSGMDFTERKLLNVWVKGRAGRLHIDLGELISEDQVWRTANGTGLHRSDSMYSSERPAPDGSRTYTDATDTGLDSIAGIDTDPNRPAQDDGNDDFDGNVLAKINGTERNGQFDSEDLLGNKGISAGSNRLYPRNEYYTFTMSLADSSGMNQHGWHKYSIPLASATPVGGPYNWNNITFARIWVDSLTAPADVELALVEVSGNQWLEQKIVRRDTVAGSPVLPNESFTIGVKNNRDDGDYSINPPYDPGKDENGNLKFEGCLVFRLDTLRRGHAAVARRGLREGETNYTGYRRMRLYVRGQSSADSFFVRLVAPDSTQYYQYQAPLSGIWQDVQIDLDALSALKKAPYNGARQEGCYSVQGSPNLTTLSRIQLGVISGRDSLQPLTGEVWFDDLRLDDVRRDRGTAYYSTIELHMADLLSMSGGYRYTGAHWYTMGSGTGSGSGTNAVSYNLNGTLSLSKFFLDRIGFNLPLSLGQTVDEGFPEFGGDDIRLTKAESRAQRSWNRSRTAGFSLARTKPSGWWLTDATIDRMTYTMGWQQSAGFSRSGADSHNTLTQSVVYGWSPSRNPGLSVLKLTKFYYLPSSLSSSWHSSQAQHWSLEKATGVQSTTGSGATRSLTGSLAWKLTDQLNVTFSQNRDLMQGKWAGDLARRLRLGSETGRSQRVEYATTISWLKVVRPALNYSTTYNEDHAVVLSSGSRDSTMVQNVTTANALTLGNDFPFGSWLAKITSLRNRSKDDSLEAGSQQWLLAKTVTGLDAFFKSWSGVQVSFTQSKSGSAANLLTRPSLWYQLGWQRRPEGVQRFSGLSGTDNNSLGNSYSASTQARLGPINLSGSWGRNDNWTVTGTVTNYSRTINWPNMRADVISVEKAWPQAWTSSRLATSYNRTTERNYQQDRGLARLAVRSNFSPLVEWSATWRARFSTSLNYDWTIQDVQEPGPTTQYLSGWRRDYTQTRKLSGSFSYALTAQKGLALNFWKLGRRRFKFNNELRLSVTGSYGVRTQKICDVQAVLADAAFMANTEELALATQAEYRFSNSITGSLTADYGSTANKVSSVSDSKRYGLNLLINVVF